MPGIMKRDGTIVQMPVLSEEQKELAWEIFFQSIPKTMKAEVDRIKRQMDAESAGAAIRAKEGTNDG